MYPIDQHVLLRRTFVHLTGIGPQTERHLWSLGIRDWDQLAGEVAGLFKGKRLEGIQRALDDSMAAWARGDLWHLHRALPGHERWRLVAGGFDGIAYFDIEASEGGMPPEAHSTAVCFYFRGEVLQEHEHGRKRRLIERMLDECTLLCTYSGASYDVPFLTAEYGMPFAKAHVDLCPWLRRQGLKGGLKAIQRSQAHLHQRCSMDIDGFDAVRLWRLHEEGVPGALETLLTYNAEDVLILEPLLVDAFNRELAQSPEWDVAPLVAREAPQLTTQVHAGVYAMLRGHGAAAYSTTK
jgi:uncharacterized protein YprB with RNaseH-like and TPR domain